SKGEGKGRGGAGAEGDGGATAPVYELSPEPTPRPLFPFNHEKEEGGAGGVGGMGIERPTSRGAPGVMQRQSSSRGSSQGNKRPVWPPQHESDASGDERPLTPTPAITPRPSRALFPPTREGSALVPPKEEPLRLPPI
ncbi:hypothetical protein B484DRAFT_405504, partial [Ochromonadaceae sp. CCMP2298]